MSFSFIDRRGYEQSLLFEFAVLPGIHTQQALIVKRVAVSRDAQFPDSIEFGLEFFLSAVRIQPLTGLPS